LSDIDYNKNCCEVNTKHFKASKQIVVKDRNESVKGSAKGSVKDNTNNDETATILKKGHKGDFTKARSNEKGREKRVDHILNSM